MEEGKNPTLFVNGCTNHQYLVVVYQQGLVLGKTECGRDSRKREKRIGIGVWLLCHFVFLFHIIIIIKKINRFAYLTV